MGCVHGQKNPHKADMGEPKHNKKMAKQQLTYSVNGDHKQSHNQQIKINQQTYNYNQYQNTKKQHKGMKMKVAKNDELKLSVGGSQKSVDQNSVDLNQQYRVNHQPNNQDQYQGKKQMKLKIKI